jgi:hypothetical protein
VRRSLVLRANPTVRQIQAILARVDRALTERGATVYRGIPGELSFRMPPPWRLARVGWLALITRGTATVSAWGGGPWRVSYRLYFGSLQALTGLVTLVVVLLGWGWPRLALLGTILALWIAGYGALHLVASHDFRRMLREVMPDVVERRTHPRPTPAAGASAPSQHPE